MYARENARLCTGIGDLLKRVKHERLQVIKRSLKRVYPAHCAVVAQLLQVALIRHHAVIRE